jgi:hypothetical protein
MYTKLCLKFKTIIELKLFDPNTLIKHYIYNF